MPTSSGIEPYKIEVQGTCNIESVIVCVELIGMQFCTCS